MTFQVIFSIKKHPTCRALERAWSKVLRVNMSLECSKVCEWTVFLAIYPSTLQEPDVVTGKNVREKSLLHTISRYLEVFTIHCSNEHKYGVRRLYARCFFWQRY